MLYKKMYKTRTRPHKTFVWVLKTGVLCEQGSYLHETENSLVQGSCANKAFWKTVCLVRTRPSHKTLNP